MLCFKKGLLIALFVLSIFSCLFLISSCSNENEKTVYDITYYSQGELYNTQSVIAGNLAPQVSPPVPGEPGRVFSHWSLSENGPEYDFSMPVNVNLILYAVWTKSQHNVNFYSDNVIFETVSVAYGESVKKPSDPQPASDGMTFLYWSLTENGEEFDFSQQITGDLSLYAVWAKKQCAVSFYCDGTVFETINVEYGKSAQKPDDPKSEFEGMTFSHWSLTENGESFDFDTPITSDTSLYAVFTSDTPISPSEYIVKFYADDTLIKETSVTEGGKVSFIDVDSQYIPEGKDFLHWSITPNGAAFDFDSIIRQDMNLYAVWKNIQPEEPEPIKYTVLFYVNNVLYKSEEIESGKTLICPEPPESSSGEKIFSHWSKTEFGDPFDTNSKVTADLILYAVFADAYHTVTLIDRNQTKYVKVEHNSLLAEPDSPISTDSKIIFSHWSVSENGAPFDFSSRILSDIKIYAVWVPNEHTVTFNNGEWKTIITVTHGENVKNQEISSLPYEGAVFSHWSKEEYGPAFDFSEPVISDLNLYAVWKPVITYVNGSEKKSYTIEYDSLVTSPKQPDFVPQGKLNHFLHWSAENNGEKEFDFAEKIKKSITLYAVWADFCIMFKNGEDVVDIQYLLSGQTVKKPQLPEPEKGKVFSHWSSMDDAIYSEWDFTSPVYSDDIVYAVWDDVYCNVKFYFNDSLALTKSVKYGEVIVCPESFDIEIPAGHSISYWSTSYGMENEVSQYLFDTTPVTSDISLYAIWKTYKVTLYNTHNSIEQELSIEGGTCYAPDDHYIWVTSLETCSIYDSSIPVQNDITLYAACKLFIRDDNKIGIGSGNSELEVLIVPEGIFSVSGFNYCKIREVRLPSSVERIGLYAFYGCTNLTEINLDNVLIIEDYAFYKSGIQKAELKKSTEIGDKAFYGCESLETVLLSPATILGNDIFYGCTALTEVDLSSLQVMGNNVFYGCSSLTEIVLPESLTTIGYGVFENCVSLQKVILPDNLEIITSGMFKNCSSLSNIELPEAIKEIGDYAFYGCSFESIVILDDILYGKFVYANNSASKIEISPSVSTIGEGWFSGNNITEVVIPDTVEIIGSSAFKDCIYLTDISLPDGLNSIEECAFQGCLALIEIELPVELSFIGNSAFADSGLQKINLNNLNVSFGFGVFAGCQNLNDFVFPTSYYSIEGAFAGMNITSVTIPDEVSEIGAYAFADCKDLKEVYIHDSVNEIGEGAFEGCSSLEYVELPSTLEKINAKVFSRCGIEKITLPDTLKEIGDYAFSKSSLVRISFPNSLMRIGNYAFSGCSSLNDQDLKSDYSELCEIGEGAFENCKRISFVIPEGVTEIKDYTFRGVDIIAFKDHLLPNTIEKIGAYAFEDCIVGGIVLPDSLEEIGEYAFYNAVICNDLSAFRIPKGVTIINKNAFGNAKNYLHKIYVDSESLNTLSANFPWGLSNTTLIFADGSQVEVR